MRMEAKKKMPVKPRPKMVQLGIRYPVELHERTQAIRKRCQELDLEFQLQEDFADWLSKYLDRAEAELAKYEAEAKSASENKEG